MTQRLPGLLVGARAILGLWALQLPFDLPLSAGAFPGHRWFADSVYIKTQGNPPLVSGAFLCAALSSLVLCSANSRLCCFPEPQLFPLLRTPLPLPGFPSCTVAWNHTPSCRLSSQDTSNLRPSQRDHVLCGLLSHV